MDEILGSSTGPAATSAHLILFAQAPGLDMWLGLVPTLIAAFLMLVMSALASMTEAAFLSLSTMKAHAMAESMNRLDRLAGFMRLNFSKPLATIVVVNNIANIAGSGLTGMFFNDWVALHYEDHIAIASGVFFGVLTLIVILAGEIVPKTYGEQHRIMICRLTAPGIRLLQTMLTPVIWLASLAQKRFLRTGARHVTSEAEIARLTDLAEEQGAIEEDESEMIQRIFRLNDITAADVMTPRIEMVTLEAGQTLADIADELGEITRSRIPVYRESRDDIVGVLDRSDALLALAQDQHSLPISDKRVCFKAFFVPETMPADDLIVTLQRRTQPLAIVVGEYGETVGLVTLEDVIEEIVGEIVDEGDLQDPDDIQLISETEILCDARIEVNDINETLGTEIPNHRTVAGLLLDEMERIPRRGETLATFGVLITVLEANEKAILKVRVVRDPSDSEIEAAEQPPETGDDKDSAAA
jgi:CBS domain containing-hemolysin-like protein